MTFDTFIAEFKSENENYYNAGLIDEGSVLKWFNEALKPFGQNIMILQDTVVDVNNSEGILPDNFYSLYMAYKCNPKGYHFNKKYKDIVQNSYMWTKRVERSNDWNSCDPCCVNEENKIITEKLILNDTEVEFYYEKPTLLKLGKSMKRDKCHKECRNILIKDSPYEIIINEKTLYSNFDKGYVYIQYYGLPTDEEGKPIIPEVGRGELERYVDYYVHLKFFEKLLKNKDDENIITLFNYYNQKEQLHKSLALTDTKFSKLTPNSFRRLKNENRREMLKYEFNFPII